MEDCLSGGAETHERMSFTSWEETMKLLSVTHAAVLLAAYAVLLACPAGAGIINGSFETGDLTGWGSEEIGGYIEVVPGGTAGDWFASLKLEGRYVEMPSGTIFGPSYVGVAQRFVVPGDAQYLLFDSWVAGFGTLHVSLGDIHAPQIIVTSQAPATYALDVSDKQGQEVCFTTLGRDTDVGDNNYAYLDNLRLTDVPEPSSMLMLGAGLSVVLKAVFAATRG